MFVKYSHHASPHIPRKRSLEGFLRPRHFSTVRTSGMRLQFRVWMPMSPGCPHRLCTLYPIHENCAACCCCLMNDQSDRDDALLSEKVRGGDGIKMRKKKKLITILTPKTSCQGCPQIAMKGLVRQCCC
jgi:hypothetical protein